MQCIFSVTLSILLSLSSPLTHAHKREEQPIGKRGIIRPSIRQRSGGFVISGLRSSRRHAPLIQLYHRHVTLNYLRVHHLHLAIVPSLKGQLAWSSGFLYACILWRALCSPGARVFLLIFAASNYKIESKNIIPIRERILLGMRGTCSAFSLSPFLSFFFSWRLAIKGSSLPYS